VMTIVWPSRSTSASGIGRAPPCQDSWTGVLCHTDTCLRASNYFPRGPEAAVRTPICDRLGIELPIFAFSHCRDVVAAVSKAGGYGVLGALAYSPDQLEIELSWIDDHVDGMPYGVDFAMPAKYVGKGGGKEASLSHLHELIPPEHQTFVEELLAEHGVPPLPDDLNTGVVKAAGLGVDEEGPGQVEVALSHPVSMVVNALGPPPPYVVEQAHERGILVGGLVGNRQHAERQVAQGTDVIVAQGTEAGGHCGDVSTMVLVPEVVDAVGPDVPVLAAGGIGRGRQMAAALALGAQGVWTGSIWLTVAEADTNPIAVEKLLAANSRGTVRSRSMTGKPARQLRTAWTDAWERDDTPDPLPMPLQGIVFSEAARRVTRAQNRDLTGFPVGQIVGSMNSVRPVRDVIFDMVEEWVETTQRLETLVETE
jgi:NAD(P)H-dependent flavin oxidoreductase YrpB (nitropropane dioxygenase family)